MAAAPPRPTPGSLIWRLAMKWRAIVAAAVAPTGLTHAQYSVLASLRRMATTGDAPSQRRLAEHTGLDPIYVSKIARGLEGAGMIERSRDPADSRAVRLTLTAAGAAAADRAIVIVRDLQEVLTAPLGGTRSTRTRDLMRDVELLLAAPPPTTPHAVGAPKGSAS